MMFDSSNGADRFFWAFLLGAIACGGYYTLHRQRNRVDIVGTRVRLVGRGGVAEFEASHIRALDWYYGFWTSFSPTAGWTLFVVTLSDGRKLDVELALLRWREQRTAFQRLADALPPMDWTIRWPYSVLPKRDRIWNSAEGRVPR